jgi:hypothetical protein
MFFIRFKAAVIRISRFFWTSVTFGSRDNGYRIIADIKGFSKLQVNTLYNRDGRDPTVMLRLRYHEK